MRTISARKHWFVWSILLPFSISLLACTAAAPPAEIQRLAQFQEAQAVFDIVDPAKAPEPPENTIGGMRKEDLGVKAKHGGMVRVNAANWLRLDPHFPSMPSGERWLAPMYASGLLKYDLKTNGPVLDLAEAWEESSDKLSYTFKIRKGVKFHNVPPVNGRELKAQDVKFSLDRVSGLTRTSGQVSFNYARFDNLKEVQVVDDYTVKLIMKQPDNTIMRELSYEMSTVLPKEAAIGGEFNDGKALIGSGPFIVELAQSQQLTKFKRNPDWFAKGPENRPYLDAVEAYFMSTEALLAAFRTKQLDWIITSGATGVTLAKQVAGNPEINMFVSRGNMVGIVQVGINPYVEPLRDVRVRRAFHLAIDRDEIVKLVYNDGAYPTSYLGGYWQPWFWSEEKLRSMPGWRQPKDQDLAEARKLLAEAGYPSGLTLTLETEDVNTGEVLVQQMKRVGITLKVNVQSSAVIRHTAFMKDKQLGYSNQGAGHTPDFSIPQSFLCDSAKSMSSACDEQVEQLWRAYRKEFDKKKMVEYLDKIQQRLFDIAVSAPIARGQGAHFAYKYVRGWRNQFQDVSWAHGTQMPDVWIDK